MASVAQRFHRHCPRGHPQGLSPLRLEPEEEQLLPHRKHRPLGETRPVSVRESAGFGGRGTVRREMTAPSGMSGTHGAVTVADGRQT